MNRREFCKKMFATVVATAIPSSVLANENPYLPLDYKGKLEKLKNHWAHPEEVAADALSHLKDATRYVIKVRRLQHHQMTSCTIYFDDNNIYMESVKGS